MCNECNEKDWLCGDCVLKYLSNLPLDKFLNEGYTEKDRKEKLI